MRADSINKINCICSPFQEPSLFDRMCTRHDNSNTSDRAYIHQVKTHDMKPKIPSSYDTEKLDIEYSLCLGIWLVFGYPNHLVKWIVKWFDNSLGLFTILQ